MITKWCFCHYSELEGDIRFEDSMDLDQPIRKEFVDDNALTTLPEKSQSTFTISMLEHYYVHAIVAETTAMIARVSRMALVKCILAGNTFGNRS